MNTSLLSVFTLCLLSIVEAGTSSGDEASRLDSIEEKLNNLMASLQPPVNQGIRSTSNSHYGHTMDGNHGSNMVNSAPVTAGKGCINYNNWS